MGKGFSLTNIEDLTPEQAIDYFKGLPGFEHISGQIREREMGFDPEALAKAQRLQKEKNKKALAASVTGIVSPEEEFALKGKEAQEERKTVHGGFFGTADLSREAQEAIGEEARIRQQEGFKLDPLERDIEVSDYPGRVGFTEFLQAEAEVASYLIGKGEDWLDKYTFGLGSDIVNALSPSPFRALRDKDSFLYVPPSEETGEILFGEKGKGLDWEEKTRAIADINEKKPWYQEVITGATAPTSIVTMPIFGTSKAVTATAKAAHDLGMLKTIIQHIPEVLVRNPEAAAAVRDSTQDLVSQTLNRKLDLPLFSTETGERLAATLFENDLRFWLNMPEGASINMAKYTETLTRQAGKEGTLLLSETNGTLQRLMDVGLIARDANGNYVKAIMSGDPRAIEILGMWGKKIGVSGGAGGRFYVADLRSLDDLIEEIVTLEDGVLRTLLKQTGINPSVAATSDMKKLMIGYARSSAIAGDLSNIAIQSALDVLQQHAPKILGYDLGRIPKVGGAIAKFSGKLPFKIDRDGIFEDTGTHWLDVFSDADAFADDLTDAQRAYIDNYIKVVDELEELRLSYGLESLTKDRQGLFYIPRNLHSIDEILLAGSDPHSSRTHELATSARMGWDDMAGKFQGGEIVYYGPRENLKVHLMAGYHEIIQEQLSKAFMDRGLAFSPDYILKELYPQQWKRLIDAESAYDVTSKTLKRLYEQRPSAYTGTTKAALERTIDEARAANGAAKKERNNAKANLTRKRKTLRPTGKDGQIPLPASLWGETGERINANFWRGNYFREEDFEQLLGGVKNLVGRKGGFTALAGNVANTSRWLQANADWGAPFIHGQPTLTRNPKVWAKSTGGQFAAFANPAIQGKFILDHIETFKEMAQYGIPVGDMEMFIALEKGQGLPVAKLTSWLPSNRGGKLLGHVIGDIDSGASEADLANFDRGVLAIGRGAAKMRGGSQTAVNQTFGRFQSSYSMFLAMNRALLWEAMKPWWTKSGRPGSTLPELAAYIRNMTGGLDTQALGVSSGQRNIESMFMAFSPKLLRSTIALTVDAMRYVPAEAGRLAGGPGATLRQKEAARSMALLLTGIHGLYISAAIGTGMAKGHSAERIRNDIQTGINPLSGKRYLSVEVDGQWFGVGGQTRALMQLLTGVISSLAPGGDPIQNIWAANSRDNPILRFIAYRGAVGVEFGATLAEGGVAALGGDFDALKYENIEGPKDALFHIGESSLPFFIQGMIEGDSWQGMVLGGLGTRTSPFTGKDTAGAMVRDAFEAMTEEELAEYDHKPGQFPSRWAVDLHAGLLNKIKNENSQIQEELNRHREEMIEKGSGHAEYLDKKMEVRVNRDRLVIQGLSRHGVGAPLRKIMQAQFKEYAYSSKSIDNEYDDVVDDFAEMDPSEHEFNQAMEEYWRVMTADVLQDGETGSLNNWPSLVDPVTMEFNYQERDRRLETLKDPSSIVSDHFDLIEEQKYSSASPEAEALFKEYDRDIQYIIDNYWSLREKVIEKENFTEKWEFVTTHPEAIDSPDRFKAGAVDHLDWTSHDAADLRWVTKEIKKEQERARIKDPVLDLLLGKWGYTQKPLNGKAINDIYQIEKGRDGIPMLQTKRQDYNRAIQQYDSELHPVTGEPRIPYQGQMYVESVLQEPVGAR